MTERTALGEQILKHWRTHLPQMVSDLEKNNQLEQAILLVQEQTGDLLYTLISQQMEYQAAWEIAMREWAFLPEEQPRHKSSTKSNQKQNRHTPPATSE